MIYGYARVSTDGQSVEAQVAALTAAGAVTVYRETASGAKTDRARLRQALAALDQGDVLLVTRLDRLARSTLDLLHILKTIADKGAAVKSLVDAWADTTTPHGKLFTLILGGLAEFERELIKARTSEGRARAKARGVKLGRRPKLTPAPAAGGPGAPRPRRGGAGDRPLLQCQPPDDFPAQARPPCPLASALEIGSHCHGTQAASAGERSRRPCRIAGGDRGRRRRPVIRAYASGA
jgi:hypothetical protein